VLLIKLMVYYKVPTRLLCAVLTKYFPNELCSSYYNFGANSHNNCHLV